MADLRSAPLRVLGRLVDASNATLLCELIDETNGATDDETGTHAERVVYKPIRGEVPLWDFPDGTLAGREVAAHLISDRLGWDLIPPTVMREGPVGAGMVQRWIEPPGTEVDGAEVDGAEVDGAGTVEPERPAEEAPRDPVELFAPDSVPDGYLPVFSGLTEDPDTPEGYREIVLAHADHPRLHRLAVLDVLLNNADRKGGHILVGDGGLVYGIDHGICLHTDPKLRTVLWGWAGRPVPAELLGDIARLRTELDGDFGYLLRTLITRDEVSALDERARNLLEHPRMPLPPRSRAIPWPPF